ARRLVDSLLGLPRILGFDAARHVLSFGVASDGWFVEQLRGRVLVRSPRARGNDAARGARTLYGKDRCADQPRAPGSAASGARTNADARLLQVGARPARKILHGRRST